MKTSSVTWVLLVLATACNQGQQTSLQVTTGANFFENSRRTDAPNNAHHGIARVDGCTGFFLKNSQNRNLIATARHCFDYDAPRWCTQGGEAKDQGSGQRLRCQSVAVGDETHDFVILEFSASKRDRSHDFTLADFPLTAELRLGMLGFPGDQFNPERKLKHTENCWIVTPQTRNQYNDPNVVDDKVFTHNCSTYGGNSGGPMFVEGTRVAVAIPDSYKPYDYTQRPRNARLAQGVSLPGFVADFKADLESYEVALATTAPVARRGDYPSEGTYQDPTGTCIAKLQRLSFNSHIEAMSMSFVFQAGCPTEGQADFNCSSATKCQSVRGPTHLEWRDSQSFELGRLTLSVKT